MASSCLHLCRRCTTFLLSKKTLGVPLLYSTHVAGIPTSIKTNPGGHPLILGNRLTCPIRQRGRQQQQGGGGGCCYYSCHTAGPLRQTDHKCAKELMGMDALNEHKHTVVAPLQMEEPPPISDSDTSLDIDVALEEIGNEGATLPCPLPPESFSLSDYVDESETLRKLVQLGVELWKLEQRPNVGTMLLKLDFQTDVIPRLLFLKRIGVEDSGLAYILSSNPFILKEELDHLQSRVDFLTSKKFSLATVASMVTRAPYLLNFSVKRIDNRLEFYQSQLRLNPSKTRDIVARLPRLLCGSLEPVKETLKVCQLELGFKENEIQHIVSHVPKVLTMNKQKLIQTFDYLHNTMKVPQHLIVKFPQVFNSRLLRIKERHLFLEYLGKAQYGPDKANYVALNNLVSMPNETFCTELASATLADFISFQKTM